MYAIARIAGKQFRLEPDTQIKVPLLPLEVGASYEISDILLSAEGEKIEVGQPLVGGLKATATVVAHGRERKIMVHRKKRRKGFQVTKGHRQQYTVLHIDSIEGMTAEVKKPRKRKSKAAEPAAGEKETGE